MDPLLRHLQLQNYPVFSQTPEGTAPLGLGTLASTTTSPYLPPPLFTKSGLHWTPWPAGARRSALPGFTFDWRVSTVGAGIYLLRQQVVPIGSGPDFWAPTQSKTAASTTGQQGDVCPLSPSRTRCQVPSQALWGCTHIWIWLHTSPKLTMSILMWLHRISKTLLHLSLETERIHILLP